MHRGIYSAASGMIAQRERLNVVANNLANVGTTGFKRAEAVSRGFFQVFAKEVARFPGQRGSSENPGGGTTLDSTTEDFSPGPVIDTGAPLDAAIDGPGFFVVRSPQGERYTRDGAFSLSPEGGLITKAGYPVMGEQGPILVQGDDIRISSDGKVIVDGATAERIRIIDFPEPSRLSKYGRNLYGATEEVRGTAAPVAEPTLRAGALEHSNVNLMDELVAMIDAQREYEAHQRAILAIDGTLNTAVNEIART